MRIDDQVCTSIQAKLLKELGIAQGHSLFVRICYMPDICGNDHYFGTQYRNMPEETLEEVVHDMFTVSELMSMMPEGILTQKTLDMECYYCFQKEQDGMVSHETLAEACADKLISLIQSFEWSCQEANQRYLK